MIGVGMTGWGAVHSGRPVRGVWTDELRMLAHKSFGTTGSLPGSQTVITTVEGCHVLDRTDQHDCNFLRESSRSITLSFNTVSMGLCPVRALRIYVDRTAQWRGSDQLFVCFGGKSKGSTITKQQMSHWLVEAISLAYKARGLDFASRITCSLYESSSSFSGISDRVIDGRRLCYRRMVLS